MAGVSATIALGLAGYSAFKSLTDKGPQAPTLPTAPPPVDTTAATAAGVAARQKATAPSNRNGTLLTGPSGVQAPAATTRKTLLGS